MCINKVIVIVGIVNSIDMMIWFLKAGCVHFRLMASKLSLRRIFVGCISVFVELFG